MGFALAWVPKHFGRSVAVGAGAQKIIGSMAVCLSWVPFSGLPSGGLPLGFALAWVPKHFGRSVAVGAGCPWDSRWLPIAWDQVALNRCKEAPCSAFGMPDLERRTLDPAIAW